MVVLKLSFREKSQKRQHKVHSEKGQQSNLGGHILSSDSMNKSDITKMMT